MGKVYVPVSNINDYSCYYILDMNTIRAYKNTLSVGDNVYTDFFINSHYLDKSGVEYIPDTNAITCLASNRITNDYFYRNDIAHIFVVVFCILILLYFMVFKIFARIFGRWLKV